MSTPSELATLLGIGIVGQSKQHIWGIAPLTLAQPGQVSLVNRQNTANEIALSNASAIVLEIPFSSESVRKPQLISPDPDKAIDRIRKILSNEQPQHCELISSRALVDRRSKIDASVQISSGCVVAEEVVIEKTTYLHPNVVVERGVRIGSNTVIHSNVVIH